MAKRGSLLFVALGSPLLLVCFLAGGRLAEAVFVALVMAFPVALMVIALASHPSFRPLRLVLVALLLVLEGSGMAMLWLQGRVTDGPWIAGLPAGTFVLLFGLWLVPLPLVALSYALTFGRHDLSDEDLQRLESVRRGEQ